MARIEGIRIRNFKSLRDVTFGQLWNMRDVKPLSSMTAVIGKNGVGKSTLFDAFGFLSDCLKTNVEEACDSRRRGGFGKLVSIGQEKVIEFEIYYREESDSRPITYELSIGLDEDERPCVLKERLRQRRRNQSRGWPFSFLVLENGKGMVWKEEAEGVQIDEDAFVINQFLEKNQFPLHEESSEKEYVEIVDQRILGIATLGSLVQHPRISAFRKFMESWFLCYFTPDAARSLPMAGPQKHLDVHGDNLGNVVQYMAREHKKGFQTILDQISQKIPGIVKIEPEITNDSRLLLKFYESGMADKPLYASQMSDGTLKFFAYMILLNDPTPPPFLCIEEPENGLYHKLLSFLAVSFREHAARKKNSSQVFVTTHQPYFVDALNPEEVWLLEKGTDGFSTIRRASDIPLINNLVEEDFPLGGLWYSDYLESEGGQDALSDSR